MFNNPKKLLLGAGLLALTLGGAQAQSPTDTTLLKKVLIINQCGAFVHTNAINELSKFVRDTLAPKYKFFLEVPTSNAQVLAKMRDDTLSTYQVIIFNNNTSIGGVITDSTQAGQTNYRGAFQRWLKNGGGLVAYHGVMDHADLWGWLRDTALAGTRFTQHSTWSAPADRGAGRALVRWDTIPTAGVVTSNKAEYAGLKSVIPAGQFSYPDEWYSFTINPRNKVDILMTIDEATYTVPSGASMGVDHPVAWANKLTPGPNGKQGRFVYTARLHETSAFTGTGTNSTALDGSLGQLGPTKGFLWEAIRYAAGMTQPTAIKNGLRARDASGTFSARGMGRSVAINVYGVSGNYDVSVFSLSGQKLASKSGKGVRDFSFNMKQSGVFMVQVKAAGQTYARRVTL